VDLELGKEATNRLKDSVGDINTSEPCCVNRNGLVDFEKSSGLEHLYYKGVENSYGSRPFIQQNGKFRKLHPIECERLQTIPELFTDGLSNTRRYMLLGNAWTVDVVAHIFRGLKNDNLG